MGQYQGKDQLPVEVGDQVTCLINKSIWSVHNGNKRPNNDPVLVFVFNFANKSDNEIKQARAAHLRLKTLRHPNILKYIDGVELPDCIYMITEEATPLQLHLESSDSSTQHLISWGLYQLIKTLGFLNNDCNLVHNNICMSSLYVDKAGEWKLSGVEFMYSYSDTNVPVKSLESLRKYDPPELLKSSSRRTEKWSRDMWGLGCLIWEIFNGTLTQSSNLKDTSKIPRQLISSYCELVSSNPLSRPNPTSLLISLREHGGYFSNPFISLNLKIEELQLMESSQKNKFFIELNKSLDLFPDNFAHYKVLPHLLNDFEFGGAGPSVLAPLLKVGKLLDEDEYQRKVVPCIVRSFGSNDRATRLNLLQQLDQFIDQLQPSVINDQLFPQLVTGFTDTVPTMREQTIKSALFLAPKLSDANLNNQLLKYFAKCQLDEQPGIRTNTTICLGKIASHLNPKTRQKVLVSAFTRSLKDPFAPARNAGIGALAATISDYSPSDIATRILPTLCHMTIDNEKTVRVHAFQVIKLFLEKLENNSETMIASAVENNEASTGTTAGWAGWAVSSLSKYVSSKPKEEKTVSMPVQKETTPSTTEKAIDENNDSWEDLDKHKQKTSEPPISSGWDDDTWDDFEPPSPPLISTKSSTPLKLEAKKSPSPDLFKDEDFWSKMAPPPATTTKKKERTTPPPVPSSLFDVQETNDWGNWDDMEFTSTAEQSKKNDPQETQITTKGEGDGWEFEEGGWESMDTTTSIVKPKTSINEGLTRQEQLQKRREERRLKQEAARQKKSSGMVLKPTGLGAVKKD